jgi:chorismate mutase
MPTEVDYLRDLIARTADALDRNCVPGDWAGMLAANLRRALKKRNQFVQIIGELKVTRKPPSRVAEVESGGSAIDPKPQ